MYGNRRQFDVHHAILMGFYFVVMDGGKIGDHHAFKSKLFSQQIADMPVGIDPLSVYLVVGGHDGKRMSFLNGNLEGPQIDFLQGPFGDHGVGGHALKFLMVADVMLEGRGDLVVLKSLYKGAGQLARQDGIFREILKISAAEGTSLNVDAGPEQPVDQGWIGPAFLRKIDTGLISQILIPAHGQAGIGGKGGRVILSVAVLRAAGAEIVGAASGIVLRD